MKPETVVSFAKTLCFLNSRDVSCKFKSGNIPVHAELGILCALIGPEGECVCENTLSLVS